MKILLAMLAVFMVLAQNVRALELNEVTPANLKSVQIPEPGLARAATGLSTYLSFRTFETKTGAVNAMMNAEARLLKSDVAVFEKRVIKSAGGYTFELKYLSAAPLRDYASKTAYTSAALALNAAMNAEAAMLKAAVPVAETGVLRKADGSYYYTLFFLSASEVKTFTPERAFSSAAGAMNEMYNTESRLLAGKVGVIEKRVTAAAGAYSFEIFYTPSGR